MTEEQKSKIQNYIDEVLLRKFTIDEHDYTINDFNEGNPNIPNIEKLCFVIYEVNNIISSYYGYFKNNEWVYASFNESSELEPIKCEVLGYIICKSPFEGKILKEEVGGIFKELHQKYKPNVKISGSVLVLKTELMDFRIKYSLVNKNTIDIVSEYSYYQCKTKERLFELIELLLNNNNTLIV